MNQLKTRNAKLVDVERVYAIEMACFPLAEAASKSAMTDRIQVFPEGFLLGELEGKTIGFINGAITSGDHIDDKFFQSMEYHEPDGGTLMIFGLDVHPDYQRRGYAAELMNEFINRAVKTGRKKIILTCKEHLVHYYEKFGFIEEGVSQSEHGGAKWYDMYMPL